ncbi:MAG: UDP-N-acetylmuramoyl-tripeptide--D-alanyl-D-alanine ligase [Dysgonamonadaceae bacterium]|jgi:UDP-N-acetylmuramoyl-tripeptide--D-alanyl-D-alanine ligase|nr:UDP-N-acetylmuramoyl-tripeptide--D-alanyl-D-alanine ligase [Dysgonamonadaceae bacterium]
MIIENLYELYLNNPLVSTDSRNCAPGSIFFALKGEKFDGNDYIMQVLEAGAACAVGDSKDLPNDKRIVKVNDTLLALQQLANYHRRRMKTPVIAITGTNGKTTTKELLAAALSSQHKTLYTQGNFNNHIGVPLTLLKLNKDHDLSVIEMGANHRGEIAALCRIACPDYGIITNIGKAHLEGFGSFEGVVNTKTELYNYLKEENKTAFVNADNPLLEPFLNGMNTVKYGSADGNLVSGSVLSSVPYLSMQWKKGNSIETYKINTQLVGKYNYENVLAAVCIASYFDVTPENICNAINNYLPQNNRSQSLQTARNHLIIDAYNANPGSMKAALDNFIALPALHRMIILGEMLELGDYSREEHQKLVNEIHHCPDLERVFLCGGSFENLDGIPSAWNIFPSTEQLLGALEKEKIEGYSILIKGSRGNRLEKTVEWL